MDSDWEEELESLFEDFQKDFVTESEMREQIEEWASELIPEEELEEVYVRMEHLIGQVEEESWERELVAAWEMYEGENKEYVS